MAITLYDATVASFIQTVGAVEGFLGKGLEHLKSMAADLEDVTETRLIGDMLPFRYQVLAVRSHSVGAVEACKSGVFSPPREMHPLTYTELHKHAGETLALLRKYTPAEINALEGRDVVFKIGENSMPFTAEGFLMTFSLPNVFFHATTAYDILRMKGVPLGKRDFMGRPKMKA